MYGILRQKYKRPIDYSSEKYILSFPISELDGRLLKTLWPSGKGVPRLEPNGLSQLSTGHTLTQHCRL